MATELTRPSEARRIASFLDALARMDPAERLAIYRSGGLTRAECALWAARYLEDVPLVNGEFEWIALGLADLE